MHKKYKHLLNLRTLARMFLGISLVLLGILIFVVQNQGLSYQSLLDNKHPTLLPESCLWAGAMLSLYLFFKFSYVSSRKPIIDTLHFVKILLFWGILLLSLILLAEFCLIFLDKSYFEKNLLLFLLLNYFQSLAVIVFLLHTFFVWKTIINSIKADQPKNWHYIFLPFTLILPIFGFGITHIVFQITVAIALVFELLISANLKWIAYLNYRQKWESISLIFVLLLLILILFQFCQYKADSIVGLIHYKQCAFALCLFVFTFICSVLAVLGLLFNLPTSSVFDQKTKKITSVNFINDLFESKSEHTIIYQKLLNQILSDVSANSGWLELYDQNKNIKSLFVHNISKESVFILKKMIREQSDLPNNGPAFVVSLPDSDVLLANLPEFSQSHLLYMPLRASSIYIGNLVLQNPSDTIFTTDQISLLSIYGGQSALALANYELSQTSLQAERYKEELDIARRVQASLIPQLYPVNDQIDMYASSFSADVVGGDYYDIFSFSPTRFVIVIGDVSGKGTAAAFTMAQVKGVFHSLVQFDLPADRFMMYANNALSRCLPKAIFVTFTFVNIDTDQKKFQQARAGHCYTLYYNHQEHQVYTLHSKGMGLGIIRHGDYAPHIQKCEQKYQSGDIILLYTDGIIEAKNPFAEEYGIERLEKCLKQNVLANAETITKTILNQVLKFGQNSLMDDDYSVVTIKFL